MPEWQIPFFLMNEKIRRGAFTIGKAKQLVRVPNSKENTYQFTIQPTSVAKEERGVRGWGGW